MVIPPFSFFCQKNEPLGKRGEQIAATYLKKKNFKILERNYRNFKGKQLGEIDIIAEKDKAIVFVEVKTRQGNPHTVFPEDNLTPAKFKKLEKIATYYLQSQHLRDMPYHFDAIAILFDEKKAASVRHFEHIFL
jgi:putative endonuclease